MTNTEHMQARCMVGEFVIPGYCCSSACARLLVHTHSLPFDQHCIRHAGEKKNFNLRSLGIKNCVGALQRLSREPRPFHNGLFRGELQGSLLEGSFDKRVHIDLPIPLPTHPTPFPFSLISTGKPPPTTHLILTPNTSSKDTKGTSNPFAKTTPVKTTPQFLPEC